MCSQVRRPGLRASGRLRLIHALRWQLMANTAIQMEKAEHMQIVE